MHGLRRVIVPATPKPTMAIQNPSDPVPTQNPDPTPIWINCNRCRQRFVSMRNVQVCLSLPWLAMNALVLIGLFYVSHFLYISLMNVLLVGCCCTSQGSQFYLLCGWWFVCFLYWLKTKTDPFLFISINATDRICLFLCILSLHLCFVHGCSYRIFRPGIFSHPKEVSFEWIRAANQTTNLVVGRMYCSKCAQPAGWKVVRNTIHLLLWIFCFMCWQVNFNLTCSLRGANGTLLSVQARFCCQFLLLVLATKNLNAVVQCDKHVGAISSE